MGLFGGRVTVGSIGSYIQEEVKMSEFIEVEGCYIRKDAINAILEVKKYPGQPKVTLLYISGIKGPKEVNVSAERIMYLIGEYKL